MHEFHVLTKFTGDGQLFRLLGWEMECMRDEVRPTDPMRFVRRAGRGYDAPYGRWGLVPHGMSLDEAKKYAPGPRPRHSCPGVRAAGRA